MSLLFSSRFDPFPAQQQLIQDPARFKICCTGRRFGKTLLCARQIFSSAMETKGDYGWITPTYEITERGIDAIRESVNPQAFEIKGRPKIAYLASGSRIFFYSADGDDPRSILGHGFDGLILDESARINADAWHIVIRPTISQTEGWCTMISTSRGRNWFYDMFTRGRDEQEPDYKAFRYPSNANPYFPQAEFDEARRTLPADVFRQEYEAEFLEDSAGVFRGVNEIMTTTRCRCNAQWDVGCDLAKHQDFTVLVAMCSECGDCHAMDRFNQIDWPLQKARIIGFCGRYKGTLYLDATGIGDPIYDDLQRQGLNVVGVKLTNQSKQTLIQDLILSIEQRKISFPANWTVMGDELKRYEYEYTASRNITYNAPSGYHDDAVIALALANRGRSQTFDILMAV